MFGKLIQRHQLRTLRTFQYPTQDSLIFDFSFHWCFMCRLLHISFLLLLFLLFVVQRFPFRLVCFCNCSYICITFFQTVWQVSFKPRAYREQLFYLYLIEVRSVQTTLPRSHSWDHTRLLLLDSQRITSKLHQWSLLILPVPGPDKGRGLQQAGSQRKSC